MLSTTFHRSRATFAPMSKRYAYTTASTCDCGHHTWAYVYILAPTATQHLSAGECMFYAKPCFKWERAAGRYILWYVMFVETDAHPFWCILVIDLRTPLLWASVIDGLAMLSMACLCMCNRGLTTYRAWSYIWEVWHYEDSHTPATPHASVFCI